MSASSSTPFPLGVFVGAANLDDSGAEASFDAANNSFDSLMGTQPAFMNTYIDPAQPIDAWIDNAGFSAASLAASPTAKGVIPAIELPMVSTASGSPSADQMYKNFAAGDYDNVLQGMVQAYASAGYMTQYWRPGVEMNMSSTPGFVGGDPSEQADWIAAFQHIYTVLHAAASNDGVNLKVVWNPGTDNGSDVGNATQTLYPGSQYVDVIGADTYGDVYPFTYNSGIYDWDKSGQQLNSSNPVYDYSLQQWASDPVNLEHYYTDPASDQWSLDGSGGSALSLQNIIDFAKSQGKPIAIGETGAGNTSDGAGVSDNPTFVQWLSSTLENSGVTVDYVSIWDANANGNYAFSEGSDGKPQEAAAWAQYFGAQSGSTSGGSTSGTSTSGSSGSGSSGSGTSGSGSSDSNSSGSTTVSTSADTGSSSSGGGDTLALQISEDYGNGDAQFTVAVDGQQVGGDYTASTLNSSGDAGTFLLTGDWGSGTHNVQVSFINDSYGGTPGTDRNLYVDSIGYNGTTYAGTNAALFGNSTDTFAVGGNTPAAYGPADTLTVNLSEDAYGGDAQFVLYIDGKAVTTPQSVTALQNQNASEAFGYTGNLGAGPHTVGVAFVNDAYAGSPSEDRNLYINGITLNGSSVFSGVQAQDSNGVANFTINATS
jgi:hypothetical protein